jgi:2-octaprenyl-6-methoxyphenol hydroxylase
MMPCDYDVLIVGGGLAGGSLALALAGVPLRVGVIEGVSEEERKASPAGARALALARGTVRILESLGIWSRIEPGATPIRTVHVSDRGHFGKTRLDAEHEEVVALGYVVRARDVEDAIVAALNSAPLDLIRPARVIGLQAGPDSVHLSLKRAEESLALSARLVVGADGSDSTVRKLAGIPLSIRDYRQTALVFEVATAVDHGNVAYERFTASGPLAFLPLGRRRCSVVWTVEPEEAEHLGGLPVAEFTARLQEAFGHWLGPLTLASERQGFPLRLVRAGRMVAKRVVLIGNAMHQIHPVAGQGFNLGLRDAAQLAERLRVKRSFGEDIGNPHFLENYAAARRRDLRDVVAFTDSVVRIFSNPFPPLALARNIGLVLLDCLPAAKHLLARRAMGLDGRLPRFT